MRDLFLPPRTAILSENGVYRYRLTIPIGDGPTLHGPQMLFVMLNPSTADAEQDDPTIRRCLGYARREGCSVLDVVNLFAYRATNPRELARGPQFPSPVGPENDRHIRDAASEAQIVVVAWGGSVPRRPAWSNRPREVFRMICQEGRCPYMLGRPTKEGQPKHPLYLPASAPLLPYKLP